jgi:hypothetical protein
MKKTYVILPLLLAVAGAPAFAKPNILIVREPDSSLTGYLKDSGTVESGQYYGWTWCSYDNGAVIIRRRGMCKLSLRI